jgi:glycosyltransferase Alg8
MWTMLVSPILALMVSSIHSPSYIVSYMIWIAVSRMTLSLVLYTYSRRVNLAFPFILYFNQLINAGVKVYSLFRLSKQRWTNRGDQRSADGSGMVEALRNVMAGYLTTIYVFLLALGVLVYSELLDLPSTVAARTLLFG